MFDETPITEPTTSLPQKTWDGLPWKEVDYPELRYTWVMATVQLIRDDGTPYKQVAARVLGPVAVHPHPIQDGKWDVTHIGTGFRVIYVNTELDAMKIAELLRTKYSQLLRLSTKEEILTEAPPELISWLLACHAAGVYLPVGSK